MLNINNAFENVFKTTPVIAFRKNTLLRQRQIISTSTVSHNQKRLKVKQNVAKEKCNQCNTS